MKVTVKDKFLNIRAGSPSLNAPCYQFLAPGSIIDVDGKLYKGDVFDGDDFWLKDEGDNYYWIGGVHHTIPSDAFLKFAPPVTGQVTFSWFNDAGIKSVWDKTKGRGASVAILDSGYSMTNTDLTSKIAQDQENMVLKPADFPGVQLSMDDKTADRHGTRCAGIIGAANKRNWIIGIAPECRLLISKISNNGSLRLSNFQYILDGISWAIAHGADIISISYFKLLEDAQRDAFQQKLNDIVQGKNVLIFACCGNGDPNATTRGEFYPASFTNCVSVGASSPNHQISRFTILSDKTILHAPGEDIESYGVDDIPSPETGTSFSTPIVAGIAALAVAFLKEKKGQWNKDDLLQKMIDTASPINGSSSKKIINVVNLFNKL